MKTQPALIVAFGDARKRLTAHGISVRSNGSFGLFIDDNPIGSTDSVDGLTAFADALDFSSKRTS